MRIHTTRVRRNMTGRMRAEKRVKKNEDEAETRDALFSLSRKEIIKIYSFFPSPSTGVLSLDR